MRGRSGQVLEACPVDPDSPSYRHIGFRSLYADHGFTNVGRAGPGRDGAWCAASSAAHRSPAAQHKEEGRAARGEPSDRRRS